MRSLSWTKVCSAIIFLYNLRLMSFVMICKRDQWNKGWKGLVQASNGQWQVKPELDRVLLHIEPDQQLVPSIVSNTICLVYQKQSIVQQPQVFTSILEVNTAQSGRPLWYMNRNQSRLWAKTNVLKVLR